MDGKLSGITPYPAGPDLSEEERIARARAAFARLSTRRSCRAFAGTPVPRAVIEYAIRAAGTAPSGANHQPWHYAVIGSPEKRRAIREAAEAEERRFYGAEDTAPKASEEWLAALDPLGTDAAKPFLETAPWLIVCFAQRKGGIAEDGAAQNYYVTERVGLACGMLIATLHEAGLKHFKVLARVVAGRTSCTAAALVVVLLARARLCPTQHEDAEREPWHRDRGAGLCHSRQRRQGRRLPPLPIHRRHRRRPHSSGSLSE